MSIEAEQSYALQREVASQFALPVLLAYTQAEAGHYDLYDFIWKHHGEVNDMSGTYLAADEYTQTYRDRRYSGCDHAGNLVVARHIPESDPHDPRSYRVVSFGMHDNQVTEWAVDEAEVVPSFTDFHTTLYLRADESAEPDLHTDAIHSGDAIRDVLDQRELQHLEEQSRQVQPRLLWSQRPTRLTHQESNAWLSLDGIHVAPMMGVSELLKGINTLRFKLGKLAATSTHGELIDA